MRRLRLLIYDGGPDWIERTEAREAIPSDRPLLCSRGSIHSMELRLASSLTKDDLLRPGMQMIEALADELIESARERRAAQKQGQEAAE